MPVRWQTLSIKVDPSFQQALESLDFDLRSPIFDSFEGVEGDPVMRQVRRQEEVNRDLVRHRPRGSSPGSQDDGISFGCALSNVVSLIDREARDARFGSGC